MNTDRPPLVTVAMPVFNAGRFLRPALMSIIRQSFRDWELYVIDDGSSDNCMESISDIHDPRVRVIRDGLNKGLAARLNEVIDLARGRYFARMDQDDISYPERFSRQIGLLDSDKRLDLVGVRALAISDDDDICGIFPYSPDHESLCARPWRGFYMIHPTWMGRTAWFRLHRYANPGPYLCEDQELLLRSYSSSRFGVVPDILFAYRVRRRTGVRKLYKTRRSVLRVQVKHFLRRSQPVYMVLAVATFIARVSMDILNKYLFSRGIPLLARYREPGVGYDLTKQWEDVLDSVRSD